MSQQVGQILLTNKKCAQIIGLLPNGKMWLHKENGGVTFKATKELDWELLFLQKDLIHSKILKIFHGLLVNKIFHKTNV